MSILIIAVIASVFLPAFAFTFSEFPDNKIPDPGVVSVKCAIPTFNDALSSSKAVFSGKVIGETKKGDTKIFEFEVKNYWKGRVGKRVRVNIHETMRYQAWLEVGKTYLIFAEPDDGGGFSIDRCSRSKLVAEAADDTRKLGKARRPK